MKKFFVILICKILRLVGKLFGRGSSLPGEIALKLCPDILSRIRLPDDVIAVSGSNGKTSTVEIIAHILTENGKKVAWNSEGSNQTEGVATMLLADCTLTGKARSDVILIESDERYARHTFKFFKPKYFLITNLFRDQLSRNGHQEWIFNIMKEAIYPESTLVLNADHPLVSLFADGHEKVVLFGVDKLSISDRYHEECYDDGAVCPRCKAPMVYAYRHYSCVGAYRCPACGFERNKPDFAVTDADWKNGTITINDKYNVSLTLKSFYNIYNIIAAFTACSLLGISGDAIASSASGYILKNGRVVNFNLGAHTGIFLTSKNENSVSYNQSISVAADSDEEFSVIIMLDAVSRKYYTADVSWIWDIEYEWLNVPNLKNIVLAGEFAHDLAHRFSYTAIPAEKLIINTSVEEAVAWLRENGEERVYAIMCFSDMDKFLSRVERKAE